MDDERENLSWQGFGDASRELATAIAADGFEPDLILSIARGGLFLAASLGYALAVKNLHVTNVEFYDGVGTTLDMPVMLPPVPSAVDFSRRRCSSPTTWPTPAAPSSSSTPSSRTTWKTCGRR